MNGKRISSQVIKIFIAFFVFCLLSFVLIFSCSKTPTKTEGITISGRVVLEDTTDYSGVTVMLFKPVEIDTALTNLNERYPGVGIEINQRTEFYWREHTPLYTTTTNKNGEWKFENIPDGEYHVVAEKEGWGWRVWYNVSKGEHNFTLKKAIQISGVISKDLIIPKDNFVYVSDKVVFSEGKTLTLEKGVIIEFKSDASLEVKGKVDILLKVEIIKKIFLIVIIVWSLQYGIKGIIVGQIVSSLVSFVINSEFGGKTIGLGLKKQVIILIPYFAISFLISLFVYYIFRKSDSPYFYLLMKEAIVFFTSYLFLAKIFKMDAYYELKDIILDLIRRFFEDEK